MFPQDQPTGPQELFARSGSTPPPSMAGRPISADEALRDAIEAGPADRTFLGSQERIWIVAGSRLLSRSRGVGRTLNWWRHWVFFTGVASGLVAEAAGVRGSDRAPVLLAGYAISLGLALAWKLRGRFPRRGL